MSVRPWWSCHKSRCPVVRRIWPLCWCHGKNCPAQTCGCSLPQACLCFQGQKFSWSLPPGWGAVARLYARSGSLKQLSSCWLG